jgi:hypothetical protein
VVYTQTAATGSQVGTGCCCCCSNIPLAGTHSCLESVLKVAHANRAATATNAVDIPLVSNCQLMTAAAMGATPTMV